MKFCLVLSTFILVLIAGCSPKQVEMSGTFSSLTKWNSAVSFIRDTLIVFRSGRPYERYLYEIEDNYVLQGEFIDDGFYEIINYPEENEKQWHEFHPRVPPPLAYDAVVVDSSQLQLKSPLFEILAGELGDTLLSSIVWNKHFGDSQFPNLSIHYKLGTATEFVWDEIEMGKFSSWNNTEDYQVRLKNNGDYYLKWFDGKWAGKMARGVISKKWLSIINESIGYSRYIYLAHSSPGNVADGDDFWLSILDGNTRQEYYFEADPIQSVLSIAVSIIISEVEKNDFEWIDEEVEFIQFRTNGGDRGNGG